VASYGRRGYAPALLQADPECWCRKRLARRQDSAIARTCNVIASRRRSEFIAGLVAHLLGPMCLVQKVGPRLAPRSPFRRDSSHCRSSFRKRSPALRLAPALATSPTSETLDLASLAGFGQVLETTVGRRSRRLDSAALPGGFASDAAPTGFPLAEKPEFRAHRGRRMRGTQCP
jgi:hypothetical protein